MEYPQKECEELITKLSEVMNGYSALVTGPALCSLLVSVCKLNNVPLSVAVRMLEQCYNIGN